jgi:hypothetical protein
VPIKQTSFSFFDDVAARREGEREREREASARSALAREGKKPTSSLVPLLMRGDHDTLEEAARHALEVRLTTLMIDRVYLSITDNRHTMISSRRRTDGVYLRLHHMFLDADDTTVRALARYLTRTDRRASARLDAYIESNNHRIRKSEPRPTRIRTRGRYHDLGDIFEELNGLHFDAGVEEVRVTWGRRPPGHLRRRRSIRLGTYVQDDRLIRIHPVLDQDWVPRFFVTYVVFHEMLHHVVPAPLVNGKKDFHSEAFRRREKSYEDYERAIAWERAHLRRLLSS